MGSYNPTCGITNLPIRWRQPVRCFLIAFDPEPLPWHATHTGHFYPTDIAWPIAPGLKSVYEDYGLPESFQVPPVAGRLIDDLFPERLVPDLLREAERGTLTCTYGMKQTAKVGLWMVHEQAYQHLLHHIHQEEEWLAEREGTLDDLVAGGRRYVDWLAGLGREIVRAKTANDIDALMTAVSEISRPRSAPDEPINVFAKRLDESQGNIGWMRMPYTERLQTLAMDGSLETQEGLEEAYALTDALAELLRFNDALATVRRSIVPQIGLGSQQNNAQAHLSLAQMTQNLAEKMIDFDPDDFDDGECDPDEDDEANDDDEAPAP